MQRLSSLDTEAWGHTLRQPGLPLRQLASTEARAIGLPPELNAILRMARIDRGLFAALEYDPHTALARLDHKLDTTELAALCAAIRASDNSNQDAGLQELRDVWSAVRAEHQRPATRTRRAES